MKKTVSTVAGVVLLTIAVVVALTGVWLNVALDGLHSRTCSAVGFTSLLTGTAGCLFLMGPEEA